MLFERLFRDAFGERLEVVDLGWGSDSRWKSELGNDSRAHVHLCVFAASDVRCHACGLYRRDVKPFIKKNFAGVLQRVRSRTGGGAVRDMP